MGYKLSDIELEAAIQANNDAKFDTCYYCAGIELIDENQAAMELINENSFNTLCSECSANQRLKLSEVVDNAINDIFIAAHQEIWLTSSGDITPEQESKLNAIKLELTSLVEEQARQNVQ